MKQFLGGLVIEAPRHVYNLTLGSRVIKAKTRGAAAKDTRLEAPEAYTLHLKHTHSLDPTPETYPTPDTQAHTAEAAANDAHP